VTSYFVYAVMYLYILAFRPFRVLLIYQCFESPCVGRPGFKSRPIPSLGRMSYTEMKAAGFVFWFSVVVFLIYWFHVWFCCVRLTFFSTVLNDRLGKCLSNDTTANLNLLSHSVQ